MLYLWLLTITCYCLLTDTSLGQICDIWLIELKQVLMRELWQCILLLKCCSFPLSGMHILYFKWSTTSTIWCTSRAYKINQSFLFNSLCSSICNVTSNVILPLYSERLEFPTKSPTWHWQPHSLQDWGCQHWTPHAVLDPIHYYLF